MKRYILTGMVLLDILLGITSVFYIDYWSKYFDWGLSLPLKEMPYAFFSNINTYIPYSERPFHLYYLIMLYTVFIVVRTILLPFIKYMTSPILKIIITSLLIMSAALVCLDVYGHEINKDSFLYSYSHHYTSGYLYATVSMTVLLFSFLKLKGKSIHSLKSSSASIRMSGDAIAQGFKYEKAVIKEFERQGLTVIHHGGHTGSGDEGVDVLAFNAKTKKAWLIQCKHYRNTQITYDTLHAISSKMNHFKLCFKEKTMLYRDGRADVFYPELSKIEKIECVLVCPSVTKMTKTAYKLSKEFEKATTMKITRVG